MQDTMRAYVLEGTPDEVSGSVQQVATADLPPGDVTVRVLYSGINYKDAMAAGGVGKMVRTFPHVPGVDLVGTVESDDSGTFQEGQQVIVTGYALGVSHWGGYAEYARFPAEWAVPLPTGMSPEAAMTIGTAGFTAMLSVLALERNGLYPARGPVVVTGATGGVGSIAIDLLAARGYEVTASSGKADMADYLRGLGATAIVSRDELQDESKRVLLKETWAGAVDSVGGPTLETLLRTMQWGGSVALTGLVHHHAVNTTVYPFILRGVNLLGVESVYCPREPRQQAWQELAGANRPRHLDAIATTIGLDEVPAKLREILDGGARGRYVIDMSR